jgi:Tol biopolymer transport system component
MRAGSRRVGATACALLAVVTVLAATARPAAATTPAPNQQFVEQVFADLFGPPAAAPATGTVARTAAALAAEPPLTLDADLRLALANVVTTGTSRTELVRRVVYSPDYQRHLVGELVSYFLGRRAAAWEVDAAAGLLAGGLTVEQVEALVVGSDEYLAAHGGTVDGFLDGLYQEVLGRPVDATARTLWRSAIGLGWSRTLVAWFVLTSGEYRANQVSYLYQRYLGRFGDGPGLSAWTEALLDGLRSEEALAAFLGTDEYFNLLSAVRDARLAVVLTWPRYGDDGGVGWGREGIGTMALDGSDRRTVALGMYGDPIWSADGRFLLFSDLRYLEPQVLVVPAGGGTPAPLTTGHSPAWSPDSGRLAVSTSGVSDPGEIVIQDITVVGGQVRTVPGTEVRIPGPANDLAWSPDGRTLSFVRPGLGFDGWLTSELWTVRADGTGLTRLTSNQLLYVNPFSSGPTWSPDGRTIAFMGTQGGNPGFTATWLVDATGGNLRRARPGAPAEYSAAWSTVANQLAIVPVGARAIVVTDTAGRTLATIPLAESVAPPVPPAWSPDGKRLFYVANEFAFPAPPTLNLYAVGADGTGHARLTTDQSIFAGLTAWPY